MPTGRFNEVEENVVLMEVTAEELKLIIEKRKKEITRDNYMEEFNDLISRAREDGIFFCVQRGKIVDGTRLFEEDGPESYTDRLTNIRITY